MDTARQTKQLNFPNMKGILFKGILLLGGFMLLNRCYYDSEEYLYPELNNSCDTANITFSVSVKKILSENCISCHSNTSAASSGGGIKLEDYANVKVAVDNKSLMGAILHTAGFSPMPLNGGSLSACEISIIQKWIDAQMPNN